MNMNRINCAGLRIHHFGALGTLALAVATGCQSGGEAPGRVASAQVSAATSKTDATTANPTVARAGLSIVSDSSLVCMVNDQYMGRPQIPVGVDGKTYYGCCAMCKGRLSSDAKTRSAVDPVSHQPVDKATALIAKTASGSTLYFENEHNLVAYAEQAGR